MIPGIHHILLHHPLPLLTVNHLVVDIRMRSIITSHPLLHVAVQRITGNSAASEGDFVRAIFPEIGLLYPLFQNRIKLNVVAPRMSQRFQSTDISKSSPLSWRNATNLLDEVGKS
jgi:hypothetical protein